MLWHHQTFALVKPSIIHLKGIETIGIRLGKLIEKALLAFGSDRGESPKKGFPCGRFNRTVKPKRFEQLLPSANGFDTTSSKQASNDSFESKAALILSKVAHFALRLPNLAVMLT
ncbi:hypothetical protein H6F76_05435 [Leptolyngbya sp. FACHB-321]|uniref:hypothetical protein n=1 Tax=Leptolyngbya sp. FACHB-321 TaxID=2692807 RepID=UPI001689364A|nr:hypothetical protein [Leptolyngbya sp. FACHB-321]MBD2034476.1 hypothetical protein [Leptolyngbya sp. FACHB-321]